MTRLTRYPALVGHVFLFNACPPGFGKSCKMSSFFKISLNILIVATVCRCVSSAARHCSGAALCYYNYNNKTIINDSVTAKNILLLEPKLRPSINIVTAHHTVDVVIEVMNGISCFRVSLDGNNHGNQKIFPILIQ